MRQSALLTTAAAAIAAAGLLLWPRAVAPPAALPPSAPPAAEPRVAPRTTLSAGELEPGDTLIIRADDPAASGAEVAFNAATTTFFRMSGAAVAVIGIDVNASPGIHLLTAMLPGEVVRRELRIRPRAFPSVALVLPPDLAARGVTGGELAGRIASGDQPTLASVFGVITAEALFAEAFAEPLPSWTDVGGFGVIRVSPSGGIRHLGVDLASDPGEPVLAANDGIVRFAQALPNFGKTVAVDHGLGIFTAYLHLSEIGVEPGERVSRRDIIGRVGSSGAYTLAPHLHFSVKIRGASVDPRRFLDAVNRALAPAAPGSSSALHP